MKRKPKLLLSIAVAVVLGTNIFVLIPYLGNFLTLGKKPASTVYFTIIEADGGPNEGLNGSSYHGLAFWPIMHVQKGQTVKIHIVNIAGASYEVHGFAIDHYFDNGVKLRPGESYNLTFVATQVGTFRVYCNAWCTIHPSMENGLLNVTST
jgi:heme/copper-type cytochrome/quinol oxidase subunit 2